MANIVKKDYILNIAPGGHETVVNLCQYENGRLLVFHLVGDSTITIPSGATAVVEGTKPDGNVYSASGTVDATAATVTIQEETQMTAIDGRYDAVIKVMSGSNMVASGPIRVIVSADPVPDDAIESDSDIQGLIAEARAAFEPLQQEVDVLSSRMDEFTRLPDGSTTADAELVDIRIGADGTTYPTAGDAVRNQVTDLKTALLNQLEPNYMVELVKGASKNTSGPLMPFMIHAGDSITVSSKDGSTFGNVQFRYYDADKNYIGYWGLYSANGNSRTFTMSNEGYYVGITTVILESPNAYIAVNNSNAYRQAIKAIDDGYKSADISINNRLDIIAEQSAKAKIINRFNKETITAGKYINPNTGDLNTGDGFFASDFIYIGDLASVTVSHTHLFVWCDENKNWLGHPDNMNSGATDLTYEIPENAVYLRFSAYNSALNTAQVGEAINRNNYVDYGIYKLPDLRINASQISNEDDRIIVDASGGGDYTSFTQAIYETVNSGIDVFVKSGTYDIVAEYVSLFGQEAVDNMADADSSIFNGFQYGVRIRNRKIEFASGAHLVCDWTGHTVDGTHRFSALGVDYNCEIIGLDLDCTATFYCIHDDYGIPDPYTVKYENCRVVGHNIYNANCIGGGCKKYSRHILNNCYFNNNLTGSATVRYHNTNAEGAEPEIYVSNCYFNNWFTPRWYGTQTSKMRVYVNNCEARSIHKLPESSRYNVNNVELYKWCNTETNPVT